MKSSRHVSFDQVRSLLDFLSRHVDCARGTHRSLEARFLAKKQWSQLADILNNCRGGTKKSGEGWSKYWSHFKNKLKNKMKILDKTKRLGSAEKTVRPLTGVERRALAILGPEFEPEVSEVSVATQEPRILQSILSVKLEREENAQKRDETTPDGSPAPEQHSEEDFEFHEPSEANSVVSNDSFMNNLYPQWLIDVERKRADAELARARAEETRAQASASAAAAASAQAEALRGLARAAAAQAEAVARIAAILDARNTL